MPALQAAQARTSAKADPAERAQGPATPSACWPRFHRRQLSVPTAKVATSVPGQLRQQIDRWAETWLKREFTRGLELRARMTLTGFARFDLAYFRHTERWFTVYRALTAAECFKEIEGNSAGRG